MLVDKVASLYYIVCEERRHVITGSQHRRCLDQRYRLIVVI